MYEDLRLNFEILLNGMSLPIIAALAKYNIAEKLLTGPKTVEELSESTAINPFRLFRFLRIASYFGLFSLDSVTKKWTNTPKSLNLATPNSESFWEWSANPFVLENLIHSPSALTSFNNPREDRNKPPFFEELQQTPELLRSFQRCMTTLTNINLQDVIESLEIGEACSVLDVGGASGSLISELLKKHPNITGGIFDRPEMAPIAKNYLDSQAVGDRVHFHQGDFFESVEKGYECIVLKHIIHDWKDEQALQIFRNCRNALNEGKKIFIVESVVKESKEDNVITLGMDNIMLMMSNGQERTLEEFEKLLSLSGFKLVGVRQAGFESTIEAIAI